MVDRKIAIYFHTIGLEDMTGSYSGCYRR